MPFFFVYIRVSIAQRNTAKWCDGDFAIYNNRARVGVCVCAYVSARARTRARKEKPRQELRRGCDVNLIQKQRLSKEGTRCPKSRLRMYLRQSK